MAHARLCWDDASVNAPPFVGVPFNDISCTQDLEPRLCNWLTLFKGHRDCKVLDSLPHQRCSRGENLAAFRRRGAPPNAESLNCSCDRGFQILFQRMWNGAKDRFIGRIDHRFAFPVDPLPAD